MADRLDRITTEYVDIEDRIRLSGETVEGGVQTFWLTQRLLCRLVPVLLQWLNERSAGMPRAEILQAWAQQAARAELSPQAPVNPAAPEAAWLTRSVDILRSEEEMTLTFKGPDDRAVALGLAPKPLRQWLGILYGAWTLAGWPAEVWPDWVREGTVAAEMEAAVLH